MLKRNKNILFSVIVANFNNEIYLIDLIKSIQKQTYTNWELVIVDDCSYSSTETLIKPYLNDPRIVFFKHDVNLGVAATFKTAFEHSSGEIIGMLGADDALVPNAIEKMTLAHLQHPSASLINSDTYWCDENLNVIEKYQYYHPLEKDETLIKKMSIGSFATFKRSAYLKTQGFDEQFLKAVDHDIYLKLDEVGSLAYVHEPLYLYRRNENGISQGSEGTRAFNYSLKARLNAYNRRLGTKKENLNREEAQEMLKLWYFNEIYYFRTQEMRMKFILLQIQLLKDIPSIIINRAFWGNTLRIFYKMS
jgi:glycosyltransferase involved in cell wall biosynthesis